MTTTDGLILTPAERAALNRYAAIHGRYWKHTLASAWMSASEPGILQQLRNAKHFGPLGLVQFKPCCKSDCQQYLPCTCACHEREL